MDVAFVDGDPDDEHLAAVVALAVQAYLDAETRQIAEPMTRVTPWVAAGRLEARELSLWPTRRKKAWGVRG
jgi:hypothetical protein